MDKYVCTVCGYVYDPAEGDPDGGIAPGTPFEKLPDDWVCPVCGASKDEFEKEEQGEKQIYINKGQGIKLEDPSVIIYSVPT